jgi:hypothetical protein
MANWNKFMNAKGKHWNKAIRWQKAFTALLDGGIERKMNQPHLYLKA